ncbi:hypothetical protein EFA46_015125 (plasmid) [Halarchaeum sp. CBA1220]|uniref:hypothetical protein n=1 Tax=Halarchaeum sp. CBA1220 TaxID=1853682 RepID=UPI000F3AA405|nr:hypothetical protein [Halarchaeum sp. CBA1220]QLC35559.1 hypothetical protein EFA46_015125 [Halarchaeum sp. CBA1220]
MALTAPWIVGILVLNVVLGAALVLGVFAAMERHVGVGAFGGIVIGTAVVYGEATFGERMLTVTVAEMKLLVLVAALGAVLGVVGTVLTVEPDL